MDSLIKIDLKPLSDLGIALLDKIEKETGWIFSTETAKKQGYKNIIDEISKREDINPIDRAVIISQFNKIKKEHKNRAQIIDKAVKLLEKGDNPEKIKDDWLIEFFDLCKNVSDEELQFVWARVLQKECTEDGKSSLRLLRTISDITKNEINMITKIAKNINYATANSEYWGIVCSEMQFLETIGISLDEIMELEELGVIKRETFSFKDGSKFSYCNVNYAIKYKKKSYLNLTKFVNFFRLTQVGMEILNLAEIDFENHNILENLKKALEKDFEIVKDN